MNPGNRRRRSKRQRTSVSSKYSPIYKSKSKEMTSSFAKAPSASRATIQLHDLSEPRPHYRTFLVAFVGVFILILLSHYNNTLVLGLSLVFPGISLLLNPPQRGLGKLADLSALVLLTSLFLAFLPSHVAFYSAWRMEAINDLGIKIPMVLSIQPWITFEACLIVIAGFGWLYAALQWPINLPGRRRLSFWLAILIASTAGFIVWLNLINLRVSGISKGSYISSSFNLGHMANLLSLGGVTTFAYTLQVVQRRALRSILALSATLLCLAGLFLEGSRTGVLFYLAGVLFCCLFCLRTKSFSRSFKKGLIFTVLVIFLVVLGNNKVRQKINNFVVAESGMDTDLVLNVYKDTALMVLENPLTGVGLGNFAAIFPQYREASVHYKDVNYPKSDILWFIAEGGLLAILSLIFFVVTFARCYRGLYEGKSAIYRIFSLITVFVFLILSFCDVPAHSPALAYFAVLFAILALPKREFQPISFSPIIWKSLGAVLLFIGLLWSLAGLTRLPWHSTMSTAGLEEKVRMHIDLAEFKQANLILDKWISLHPMDWRAYSQRARLSLSYSGNLEEALADFERARFLEPVLGIVGIEEGNAWMPYYPKRAISAWGLALRREIDKPERYFSKMLMMVEKSPDQMDAMAEISRQSPSIRAAFLSYIKGDRLMRELQVELERDPSLSIYNREQRTNIISHWIKWGDKELAAEFITANEQALDNAWWLRSLIYEGVADYLEAVKIIRASMEKPEIPKLNLEEDTIVKLKRECVLSPTDLRKVRPLMYDYIKQGSYDNALTLLERYLEYDQLPFELIYWRAECLYHVEDYVESWLAFEAYLKIIWGK
ncbi:MAG: O-antigen ligase family protein [Verrucomicrobiota bacterium]|nr:O-antigen ligase family protein [Verrucomicrobiota bacterium]